MLITAKYTIAENEIAFKVHYQKNFFGLVVEKLAARVPIAQVFYTWCGVKLG